MCASVWFGWWDFKLLSTVVKISGLTLVTFLTDCLFHKVLGLPQIQTASFDTLPHFEADFGGGVCAFTCDVLCLSMLKQFILQFL